MDSCAAIWLAEGEWMAPAALEAIGDAMAAGIFVSPLTAWEIGRLSSPSSKRPALRFLPDAETWFARLMAAPGFRPAPFTPEIALAATRLPGQPHRDPIDRMLIATARVMGVAIVTRDRLIVAYGKEGHVGVVAC